MRKNQENRAFNHRNRKNFTNVHFELYLTQEDIMTFMSIRVEIYVKCVI